MNTITKRIGIFRAAGAAASALIVGGLVAPAQASTPDDAQTTSADGNGAHGNDATGNGVTGNGTSVAPKLDRSLTSDIGDVASGNAVGNGNNAVVGSGNDVSAPMNAPVSPTVTAPVDGADVGSNVGDTNSSVKDLIDSTLGDSLDLGTTLGR